MTTFPAAPEATIGLISTMSGKMPPQLQHEADTVQALLQAAVDETQPAVIFHGHWHQQNRCRLNARSEVVGLAADGHPVGAGNSAVVVDLPRLGADAESSCTESRTDSWSPDGARNPWSVPTTELWAPTGPRADSLE